MWPAPGHATRGRQNQDMIPKTLAGSPAGPQKALSGRLPSRVCAKLPLPPLTFLVHYGCPQHINQLLPTEVLQLQQPRERLVPPGPRSFAGASRLQLMSEKGRVRRRSDHSFPEGCPLLSLHTLYPATSHKCLKMPGVSFPLRHNRPHFTEKGIATQRNQVSRLGSVKHSSGGIRTHAYLNPGTTHPLPWPHRPTHTKGREEGNHPASVPKPEALGTARTPGPRRQAPQTWPRTRQPPISRAGTVRMCGEGPARSSTAH